MPGTLLPFMRFHDLPPAEEIAVRLKAAGIPCSIEDNRNRFDVSFAYNNLDPEISVMISGSDFPAAHATVENYFEHRLGEVGPEYYLFSFSNEELTAVLRRPDEWGPLDYVLAQKILKDRGCQVRPEDMAQWKLERLASLALPATVARGWIGLGYFLAVCGGVFGFVMGGILVSHKNILPDGSRAFAYQGPDRRSGRRIIRLSFLGIFLWAVFRFGF